MSLNVREKKSTFELDLLMLPPILRKWKSL